jgi:hypothetical protein
MKMRLSGLGLLAVLLPLGVVAAPGQEAVLAPPDSLVLDNVPAIPASLAETVGRYGEMRDAFPADWHPERREILISTRFGNTSQIHLVKMPGGARQQLTFFPEPVHEGGRFHPRGEGRMPRYTTDIVPEKRARRPIQSSELGDTD